MPDADPPIVIQEIRQPDALVPQRDKDQDVARRDPRRAVPDRGKLPPAPEGADKIILAPCPQPEHRHQTLSEPTHTNALEVHVKSQGNDTDREVPGPRDCRSP